MKRFLVATCIVFSAFACSKDGDSTEIPQAIQKLIDSNTSCVCDPYINKYEWQGKIVYMSSAAGPACQVMPLYYNEDGTRITFPANYTYANFAQDAKFLARVWDCSGKN